MDTWVEFETLEAGNRKRVGIATLKREKALNSLRLETIDLLLSGFREWIQDPEIACLVLRSNTDRAFCAGADITALYHAIREADGGANPYGEDFFAHEYELDFIIHQCRKPILAWGHQVVMGGGLGLLAGCSHRVGTPQARIAMPEITIGLFPDAGASYFLSRMRNRLGYFIGLTGCPLDAGDARDLGIIDQVLNHGDEAAVMEGLRSVEWTGGPEVDRKLLSRHLADYSIEPTGLEKNLLRHEAAISALVEDSLAADDFFDAFGTGLEGFDEPWLQQAAQTFFTGCAVTARVFVEQMQRARDMSLADMFRMELIIACQCLRQPDFPEGIRALLIDKDRRPRWRYRRAGEVPDDLVMAHFEAPWPKHPLAGL